MGEEAPIAPSPSADSLSFLRARHAGSIRLPADVGGRVDHRRPPLTAGIRRFVLIAGWRSLGQPARLRQNAREPVVPPCCRSPPPSVTGADRQRRLRPQEFHRHAGQSRVRADQRRWRCYRCIPVPPAPRQLAEVVADAVDSCPQSDAGDCVDRRRPPLAASIRCFVLVPAGSGSRSVVYVPAGKRPSKSAGCPLPSVTADSVTG